MQIQYVEVLQVDLFFLLHVYFFLFCYFRHRVGIFCVPLSQLRFMGIKVRIFCYKK